MNKPLGPTAENTFENSLYSNLQQTFSLLLYPHKDHFERKCSHDNQKFVVLELL
jgi:hypothetical protein